MHVFSSVVLASVSALKGANFFFVKFCSFVLCRDVLCYFVLLLFVFYGVIIYMQKFQHAHWLRARQLIPNSAES